MEVSLLEYLIAMKTDEDVMLDVLVCFDELTSCLGC